MSGYTVFAQFYDILTQNVDYPARARFFSGLIDKHAGRPVELLLDLACGTGRLSREFQALGYDVIGVDSSPDMLSVAKRGGGEDSPMYLCQNMQALDLYGTVDACVCALDSLNHLDSIEAVTRTMERVSLFLAPGGVFLFDMNTPYKHREVLGDNTFVYETDEVFCVWRNAYRKKDDRINIMLDFFVPEKSGGYKRFSECFSERVFTQEQIASAAKASGLDLEAVYGDDTTNPPDKAAQRLIYAAKKPVL